MIKVLGRLARHPAVWVPVVMLAAAGLLVLLLGPVSWWATPAKHLQGKDKADVRNATRQIVLAAVGGMVLLTGAAFTARTFFLTRRGQFTDRYTKAIGQLASEKLTERLGGIYALEHLMIESERDHKTVVEVLAAFVRENAEATSQYGGKPTPSTDVQAALTVLGRRPDRFELNSLDLHDADLRGSNLEGARLDGAHLRGAQLQGADLRFARMVGSNLIDAQLQEAWLQHANLTYSQLDGSNLEGARLGSTRLEKVILNEVHGLTFVQLAEAIVDHRTFIGPELRARLRSESAGLIPNHELFRQLREVQPPDPRRRSSGTDPSGLREDGRE